MKVDVVVIGAGALGLSTALHCALAGRSVVVVERDTAGAAASGRAAGLFKSVQADELRTWLARRSIEKALTWGDWAGVPLEVIRSGSLLVARTGQYREFLRTEAAQSHRWGANVRVDAREDGGTASGSDDGSDLADRAGYYHGSPGDMAVWCPEDIYIEEPMGLVQAYVGACRLHGVEILEHEAVTAVPAGSMVSGVETTARSISAQVVVDAAGAWVRQVAELAGGQVAVAPVRHQLLITAPSPEVTPADAIVRVVDAAVYLRPARAGLMVGGFEQRPLAVDPRREPDGFRTSDVPLDLDVVRQFCGQVAAQVPLAGKALASDGQVAEHRGGLFTMSPDGRFVVGPVLDVPGLWVASGCNGSGFSSSPALGETLASWIVGGEPPVGLAALSPDRFGPLSDDTLVRRGVWQYAHYYDPAGLGHSN